MNSATFQLCSKRWCVAFVCAVALGVFIVVSGYRSADAGDVVGLVMFDGPRPQRSPIQLRDRDGKLSDCHQLHKQGLLDENLIVAENGGLANAFVYIKKGYEKRKYPAPAKPAVVNQVGCMFRPRVQGVMIGQDFVMKNGDPVLHNVRALSFRNRPFNVGQPAGSPDRTKVFNRKEKAVTVHCDLHPWMKAYYFVMDHPWFAVTDVKGQFRIEELPAGDYTLTAWHEELGEQDAELTVTASSADEVTFSLKPKKSNVVIPKLNIASPSGAGHAPAVEREDSLPARRFVRKWKIDDLVADANDLTGRSRQRGHEIFAAAGCSKCHVIAGQGAKYGPDLSDVAKRFQGAKLLQQVLNPSSEIHKEFQTQLFLTSGGRVVSGLVVKDAADALHVLPNPLKPDEVKIVPKTDIDERRISDVSTMPEGLLDTFTRDEILDLLGFVQSGGKIND